MLFPPDAVSNAASMTAAQDATGNAPIEGAYFHDLLAQPDTLRAVRKGLENSNLHAGLLADWQSGKSVRVLLTGMGSSLHAAYPLHRALSHAGFTSHWIAMAELLLGFEPLYSPQTLLVAISQSGESAARDMRA